MKRICKLRSARLYESTFHCEKKFVAACSYLSFQATYFYERYFFKGCLMDMFPLPHLTFRNILLHIYDHFCGIVLISIFSRVYICPTLFFSTLQTKHEDDLEKQRLRLVHEYEERQENALQKQADTYEQVS